MKVNKLFICLLALGAVSTSAYAELNFRDANSHIVERTGNTFTVNDGYATWSGVPSSAFSPKQIRAFDREQKLKATSINITRGSIINNNEVKLGTINPQTTSIDTSTKPTPADLGNIVQSIKPNQPTIRVAASTLNPSTKVQTDKGIVPAGTLPKTTQVSVPFDSAFNRPAYHGNAHSTNRSYGEHGTGNGANNAAATHSAHGLGGNEHTGGGRSGGGFHY